MGPFSARSKRSSFTGSDVVGGSEDDSVMADKRAKKGAKNYCAAGGPNKVNCSNKTGTPGISMHYFPKEESLRQKWTRFVRINRKDFVPKKSSCLCSAHFDDSCFEHKPVSLRDATGEAIELKKRLIKGSVPTRTAVVPYTSPLTDRKRRRVSEVYLFCAHFVARGIVFDLGQVTHSIKFTNKSISFRKSIQIYFLTA